jgi:hypothetical protein
MMRKQTADLVRNYVRSLTEGDLGWLHSRLSDRLDDDVASAINFMSKNQHMDKWFDTSKTAEELYDMVDIVQQYVEQDSRLTSSVR